MISTFSMDLSYTNKISFSFSFVFFPRFFLVVRVYDLLGAKNTSNREEIQEGTILNLSRIMSCRIAIANALL